jgi:hypothetical protein
MTGIWKEPSHLYITKLRQRRNLEDELKVATGQTFPDRKDEAIYEMNLSKMFKTFMAEQQ